MFPIYCVCAQNRGQTEHFPTLKISLEATLEEPGQTFCFLLTLSCIFYFRSVLCHHLIFVIVGVHDASVQHHLLQDKVRLLDVEHYVQLTNALKIPVHRFYQGMDEFERTQLVLQNRCETESETG